LREALARDDSAVSEELRKKYHRAIIRRKKRLYSKARTAQLVEIAKRNMSKFWKRLKKRL
jgi:hypothetical protein